MSCFKSYRFLLHSRHLIPLRASVGFLSIVSLYICVGWQSCTHWHPAHHKNRIQASISLVLRDRGRVQSTIHINDAEWNTDLARPSVYCVGDKRPLCPSCETRAVGALFRSYSLGFLSDTNTGIEQEEMKSEPVSLVNYWLGRICLRTRGGLFLLLLLRPNTGDTRYENHRHKCVISKFAL